MNISHTKIYRIDDRDVAAYTLEEAIKIYKQYNNGKDTCSQNIKKIELVTDYCLIKE